MNNTNITSQKNNRAFSTCLSDPSLNFCPGGEPVTFWVAVQNQSETAASFQVSIKAAGVEETDHPSWYRLVSADAYNIPSKDAVKFKVEILDVPPCRKGFVGILSLHVNIYSPEIGTTETQLLKLCVTGIPPKVMLYDHALRAAPNTELSITADVINPNQHPASMALRLTGLPPHWLVQNEKNLLLPANAVRRVAFLCKIPSATETDQGLYYFSADVLQSGMVKSTQAAGLEVLPAGEIELQCDMPHQQVPNQTGLFFNQHPTSASYSLTVANRSNTSIKEEITLKEKKTTPFWKVFSTQKSNINHTDSHTLYSPTPDSHKTETELAEDTIAAQVEVLSDATQTTQLTIDYRAPWLGWGHYKVYELEQQPVDANIQMHNVTPTVTLKVLPIISRWTQGVGLVGMLMVGWLWLFQGHHAAVTHAQLYPASAVEENNKSSRQKSQSVISGDEKGRLLVWPLNADRLWKSRKVRSQNNLENHRKIEVVRHRSRQGNDLSELMAVGFKNGNIELYDWAGNEPINEQVRTLTVGGESPCKEQEKWLSNDAVYEGDRIYDLKFDSTDDVLYSAHGSGRVLKWSLKEPKGIPVCLKGRGNTLTTMASVERGGEPFLAVAGQYNHLNLIPTSTEQSDVVYELSLGSYSAKPVSGDNHIRTIDSPDRKPHYLAAGDDSGNVTIVNLASCREKDKTMNCANVVTWQAHADESIRSVAFSEDGCYLASAADDGKVKLWPTFAGNNSLRIFPKEGAEGYVVRRARQWRSLNPFKLHPLETVDVSRQDGALHIVSGGKDQQVHLNEVSVSRLRRHFGQHQCPTSLSQPEPDS